MKGFKDSKGKFRPTEKRKSGLKKVDIKFNTNNPIKGMKIAYKKHLDEKKKKEKKPKKTLDEIIDEEVERRVENLSNDDDAYDDYLDEVGDMNQLIEDYSFSRVLKESDPTAYRVGMNDWQDMELREMENEIRSEAEESAMEELEGHEDDKDYDEKLSDLTDEKEDEIRQDKEDELDEERYDDYLDEVGTGDNEILGNYSTVLKEIDEIAYRTGRNDWADGERDRIRDEVTDEIDEDASLESGEFEEQ